MEKEKKIGGRKLFKHQPFETLLKAELSVIILKKIL